jgi:hypothetical protein
MSVRPIFALSALLAALPTGAIACSGSLHIELEHAGVYALDYATIVKAEPGFADCQRDTLVMTQNGEEVPIRTTGEGATLGPQDHIEWVGRPLHGPMSWFDAYSTVNVYQLTSKPGPHARIADVPAPAAGGKVAELSRRVHLEQENMMIRLNQTLTKSWQEPDVWHWAKLTHVDPKPYEVTFDLPDLVTRGGAVAAKVNLRGMSEVMRMGNQPKADDHHVKIVLNGTPVGELVFDGRDEQNLDLKLPLASLKAQGNKLELSVPKRALPTDDKTHIVDVVMFNWFELDYPIGGDLAQSNDALYATTGGTIALRKAGDAPALFGSDGKRYTAAANGDGAWRYAAPGADVTLHALSADGLNKPTLVRKQAPSRWHDPTEPVDYLLISHSRLIDAARPLAEFHERRGMKVAVIDVDDIYDEFNHGISHPKAIRSLLERAYNDWPKPAPRFALLVGDASFDIRHQRIDRLAIAKWADNELLNPGTFGDIPSTPYAQTENDLPHRNLIPTWQFASYDGQSASDNHFASVGTDPLHPVIAIGRLPVVDPAEVTAIVNKTISYMSTPRLGAWRRDVMFITDESDYFKSSSDQIANELGQKGFLSDKVYASTDEKDNIAHQSAIKDGLNEGRLLVHFIGHGGRYIWRTGPPDLRKNHDLFTLDDVSHLKNGANLPMILSMTCYSAPFDNPTEDSIGERFLREADRGAIAVFAASWRNSPSPEYSKAVVRELTKRGATIGEALVAAKKTNRDETLVETYNLLGDPAVILERPDGELTFARVPGPFGSERVDAIIGKDSFRGQVAVDWVDEKGNITHTERFSALGNRFALPTPPRDAATKATELRAYVADPTRGFDAIGRLVLRAPEPPKPVAPAAPKVAVAPPAPVVAPGQQDPNAPTKLVVDAASAKQAKNLPDAMLKAGFEPEAAKAKTKAAATAKAQSGSEPRPVADSSRGGGGDDASRAGTPNNSRNALRK